jgi:hypothetical protein
MHSTIPYDPQLVLADIVSQDALDLVVKISDAQAPVDTARDKLNSYFWENRPYFKIYRL